VHSCCMDTIAITSSARKFAREKIDGRIIFDLWKIQVKNVLIQSRLHKVFLSTWTLIENNAKCIVRLHQRLNNFQST